VGIAVQDIQLVPTKAFQRLAPGVLRKIDRAGNVALCVIFGCPNIDHVHFVVRIIRSISIGPVVKVILVSKNSLAFAGSFLVIVVVIALPP
jgi:hypothetical protein